jgi:enoyl-CoA hydratase/carnithine racemase
MVLLAERIGAEEAKNLGLVTRIAAEGELEASVSEAVEQLLDKPPTVLSMAKEALVRCEAASDNESAFALQQDLAAVVFDLPEREERMSAFLKKG